MWDGLDLEKEFGPELLIQTVSESQIVRKLEGRRREMIADHVLLVEDSVAIHEQVQAILEDICSLTCVTTIGDAQKVLKREKISLVLLDLGLPDGDGLLFCKELRSDPEYIDLPIIVLTAEESVKKKILGFKLGADDYVVKPFDAQELVARVESKMRRRQSEKPVLTFCKHDFFLDLSAQRAFLIEEPERRDLSLTPAEFRIFLHLLYHEGQFFTRQEIIKSLWGPSVHVTEGTIATHVSGLRKKIGIYGECLAAGPNQGYKFSIDKLEKKSA